MHSIKIEDLQIQRDFLSTPVSLPIIHLFINFSIYLFIEYTVMVCSNNKQGKEVIGIGLWQCENEKE